MKVIYKGEFEKRVTGCVPCHKKAGRSYTFSTSKTYYLPSGVSKTFYLDKPVDVSEIDGNFLLSYNYIDVNGHKRAVFEKG